MSEASPLERLVMPVAVAVVRPFIEQHHYSKAQVLDKLRVDTRHHTEWPEDLRTMFSPGMRIWHFLYGEGFTISIDESRNAPYLLCYINGQTKWYPAPFRDP